MMLKQTEIDAIRTIAGEFGVKRVLLFGSSLEENSESSDIDLAVEGIVDAMFFKFLARLISALPKPVDLIDMSDELPINQIIRRSGKVIYG
jgi:predicted nucleotidyltransferase